MAQTLKFGNGTWATKKGSTLAYNDENDRFKPLPFTTTRASGATRVNKEGLIEVVENDRPRIDYTDSANGALLLEPSRTNLETNSSEFTGGLIGVSILRDVEPSPDGTISSDKLSDNSASGEHLINSSIALSMVSGTSYTISVFFKSDGTGGQGVIRYYNGSTFHYGVFNLDNGVVSYNSFGTSKIEAYSNGWYRCSISFTATGAYSNPPFQIAVANASNQFSYQGASNLSIYFWGAQVEQGSYATSYIPTSGSAVTRVADACNNGANEQVINSIEGVFYAETASLVNLNSTPTTISISDGTATNFAEFRYDSALNNLQYYLAVGGTFHFNNTTPLTDIKDFLKIAIKWKVNDFSIWINGVEVDTATGAIWSRNTLNRIDFAEPDATNSFRGKTKDLRIYNTALTDNELQKLTSN